MWKGHGVKHDIREDFRVFGNQFIGEIVQEEENVHKVADKSETFGGALIVAVCGQLSGC